MRPTTVTLLLAAFLGGCAAAPSPTFDGPVYPAEAQKLDTLDIQVIVGDHDVTLMSGTSERLGPAMLWLNRWFGTPIDGLEPGGRLVVPLAAFEDEYGMTPREGGFFATQDRDVIVSAEVATDAGLRGLRLLGERN